MEFIKNKMSKIKEIILSHHSQVDYLRNSMMMRGNKMLYQVDTLIEMRMANKSQLDRADNPRELIRTKN